MNFDNFEEIYRKLLVHPDVQNMMHMLRLGGYDDAGVEKVLMALLEFYDPETDTIDLADEDAFYDQLLPAMSGYHSPIQEWIENTTLLDWPAFADLWLDESNLFDIREELIAVQQVIDDELGEGEIGAVLLEESEPRFLLTIGKTLEQWLPQIVTGELIEKVYHRLRDEMSKTGDLDEQTVLEKAIASFNMLHGRDNPYPIYLFIKSLLRELKWVEQMVRVRGIREPAKVRELRQDLEDGLYVALNYAIDGQIVVEDDNFDELE